MNLYDELIAILQDGKELGFTYDEIDDIIKALERAKKVEEELKYTKEQFDKYWKEVCILKPKLSKVEELVKSYEVLVHDYEQLLETKDSKEWSLLRFHIIELKRIIDKRVEELK